MKTSKIKCQADKKHSHGLRLHSLPPH
jgi:hypothetical protein